MKCKFIKPNTEQCDANAMHNNTYCFSHNPETAEAKILAVTKGGQANRLVQSPLLPIELSDSKSVVNLLVHTIGEVRSGVTDIKVANCIGFLASHLIRALELSDLENRVTEIERMTIERINYRHQ